MLIVTMQELKDIINCNDFTDRFEVIHNGLPKPTIDNFETYDAHDYMEDDGREYWIANFKDKNTGTEYEVHYTQYEHYEFGEGLFDHSDNISIVKESVLKKEVVVEKTPEPIQPKTESEILYDKIKEMKELGLLEFFDINTTKIPKDEINELIRFISEESFSMNDLRAKIYPICLEYKTETNSFWAYIRDNKR